MQMADLWVTWIQALTLTKRSIDAAKYDGSSRDIRWDGADGISGFGLRVYPSGKKSFVLQYRKPGLRSCRFTTLGKYGVLTLDQARKKARRFLVDIGEGADPLDGRPPSDATVKQFAKTYVEDYAKGTKKTWRGDERRLQKHIIHALGSRSLIDVQRPDVAKLHLKISQGAPIEANRVLALISHLFTKAEEWGYLPEGHPNPARHVQKNKEKTRDRWLKPAEVKRLMKAVADQEDVFVRGAVVLYLLTGLRKVELLSAQWRDVDLERAELRLGDTKSGRPHSVHLSPEAVHVFRQLPREKDSPWVFPGRGGSHRKDIKYQWEEIRREAGLEEVRLHDLRRTVGSWMAQAGVPLQVIGKVLNHSHPAVTEVYARLADEQSVEALDVLGARMGEVLQLPSIGADDK